MHWRAPVTAFQYDWNLLPLGQQLWLDWFETLKEFPPMQAPESYNLTQIMDQIKSAAGTRAISHRIRKSGRPPQRAPVHLTSLSVRP